MENAPAQQLKFSFGLGDIIARDVDTGAIVAKARMTDLRRRFYETGELPPVFQAKIARELIGIGGGDKTARKAEYGWKWR